MKGFEALQHSAEKNPEEKAELQLQQLLDNPDNAFLSAIPSNLQSIEDAETATLALLIAEQKIEERNSRVFAMKVPEGVESEQLSYKGMRRALRMINESAQQIGMGGDAFVVVSKVETLDGVSEVCYKFSKAAETPRGRNVMDQEMDIHSQFYELLSPLEELQIGVPKPLYYCEMANQKFIAMEKLPARSVDDLLRGFGSLPDWFDDDCVDVFCDELTKTLDVCHANGLYHRDLHMGNIMVAQAKTREDAPKLGYIIDFGLSSRGIDGMEPYKKEAQGRVFTYADDYGRIKHIGSELKKLKKRIL